MKKRLTNVTEDLNKTIKHRDAKSIDLQATETGLAKAKEDAEQNYKFKIELAALTVALRSIISHFAIIVDNV